MTVKVRIHAPQLTLWQSDDCYTHVSFKPTGRDRNSIRCFVHVGDGAELSWDFMEPIQYLKFTTAIGKNAVVKKRSDHFSDEHASQYSCVDLVFPENFMCYKAGHSGVFLSHFSSDKQPKKKK